MRVAVCGSRHYTNERWVRDVLDTLHAYLAVTTLIHGGATGVDTFAGRWAEDRDVEFVVVHADWEKFGRAAGPIRNRTMVIEHAPDLVVAFPGGTGTTDMVRQAVAAGIEVRRIAS